MDKISIIVLNWNGASDTKECIKSLSSQIYKNYTIILVDNGSTDTETADLLKFIEKTYPQIVIIKNKSNLGFAGGVNVGIEYSIKNNYDGVALFNNDAVADPEWLSTLVKCQQARQSGITTGLLLHSDGTTIDSTGDWYTSWGLPYPRSRNQPTKLADKSGFVFSGSGGASLYSTEMLKDIGLFDETFFAYYEDVDISFRAQLYGWRVYYTDKAVAYHKQGASSGKVSGFTTVQTFKNLPLLFIKNVPSYLIIKVGLRFYFAYFLMLVNATKKGNGLYAVKGFAQHVKIVWSKSLKDRRRIQHKSISSRNYMESIIHHDLPPDQTGLRKLRSLFIRN